MNLDRRLTKLEGSGPADNLPAPEAFILYAGPRDPHAIVRALGLEDMRLLTAEVWEADLQPNDPPELVDGIMYKGRGGMSPVQQKFSKEAGKCFGSGKAWSFCRAFDGQGWVLDRSDPDRHHLDPEGFRILAPITRSPEHEVGFTPALGASDVAQ